MHLFKLPPMTSVWIWYWKYGVSLRSLRGMPFLEIPGIAGR